MKGAYEEWKENQKFRLLRHLLSTEKGITDFNQEQEAEELRSRSGEIPYKSPYQKMESESVEDMRIQNRC